MHAGTINPVDLGVIAILLISAFFAFVRGFTKEVLSILGWVGAALVTFVLFNPLKPFLRHYLSPHYLADAVTGFVIFLATLVILSLISHAIAVRVRQSPVGAIDRSLGFLFGVVRGAVVISIAYLLVSWVLPRPEQPAWLTEARSLPLMQEGGQVLLGFLPDAARERSLETLGEAGAKAKTGLDAARALEQLSTPPAAAAPAAPDTQDETGYKNGERRALDNLIQNDQSR